MGELVERVDEQDRCSGSWTGARQVRATLSAKV